MRKFLSVFTLLLGVFAIAACDLDADEHQIDLQSDLEAAELTVEPDSVVEAGTEVTITASEVDGYAFVEWIEVETGETFSESREYTFTPEIDMTLEAVYEEDVDVTTYTVTLSSDVDGAELTIDPSDTVEEGEDVTIEASEVEGYEFLHWYDEGFDFIHSEERIDTFEVDRDFDLVAVYEPDTDPAEQAADDTIDAFEGDLSHLQAMMDEIEETDSHTMVMNLSGEFWNDHLEEYETLDMTLSMVVEENAVSTYKHIHFDIETPDENLEFELYVNETDFYYELFLDVSLFLDMIEEEDEIDFREIMAVEDHIAVLLPKDNGNNDNEMFDDFFEALEEEFGISREVIMGMIEDVERFDQFFTLDYWNEQEHLDVEIDKVDETYVETTIVMSSDLLKDVFEDFVFEMYHFIEPLDIDDEMPPYDDFVESEEYQEMLGIIDFMEDFNITITHEPYTNDAMDIHMDITEMFPEFNDNGNGEFDEVEAFDFTMAYEAGGTVELPEDTRNIFEIVDEVLQIAILIEAQEYANAVYEANLENDTYTLVELYNMGIVYSIPLMDGDLSEITVTDDSIVLDFYFKTNQEAAFTEPLDRDTLNTLDPEGTPPETRDEFLDLIAHVDEDNVELFEKLALLLEFLMEEDFDEQPLPDNDLEGQDYEHLDRYPDSIIYGYHHESDEDGDIYNIQYGAETTVESAYQFYLSEFDTEDWEIFEQLENEQLVAWNNDHEFLIVINLEEHSPFENAITIGVHIDETYEHETAQLPEDDVEGEDYEHLDRYEDAVILEYTHPVDEDDNVYQIIYGAETTVESAYQFYADYFDNGSWDIQEDEENDSIQAISTEHDFFVYIDFEEDSPYDDSIIIAVYIDEDIE